MKPTGAWPFWGDISPTDYISLIVLSGFGSFTSFLSQFCSFSMSRHLLK